MNPVRIWVDPIGLVRNVSVFLRTPAANAVYDEFDMSVGMAFLMTCILFVSGLVMLATIVHAVNGVKALWSCVTLAPFRQIPNNVRHRPESIRPLLGHGIIIGPTGHALVIGAFSLSEPGISDWLAQVATFLGHLYRDGAKVPDHEGLFRLLRDDKFHSGRRRKLPEPFAQGREVYLFDVLTNIRDGVLTPHDSVAMLFVTTGVATGQIKQIPWSVAGDAIRFA